MIEISNIKKNYQNFRLECSLNIAPGRITGIIGANGAGKSTLFKAILGLINLDEGQIKIFGKDSRKLDVHDKEKLGVVLAESGFSEYLKVKALIPILKNMYPDFDEDMFLNKCNNFNIPLNKMIKDLSTGTKAKLKVIVAISHNAEILILDEPTAGLDVITRNEVLDIIRTYMEEEMRTVIISSHISSDLENLCDDIYMINDGKIILHEDMYKLLDLYGVIKANEEQYENLKSDTNYKNIILCCEKEKYGYKCITNDRKYIVDNYPEIVIEKGNIDELIMVLVKGEKI
ncbi:ABC transporter ATP-binding protein [Eubacterium sp.]|uniref:ABC transporter ATP-binding protein n=1 Tax=Eubacterium sp. TaxID=142586 RepID=UPI00399108E3